MSFFSMGGSGNESWRDHVYGQRAAIWVFVLILLGGFFYWSMQVPAPTTTYETPPREVVWAACTAYISTFYGKSPTEAEPYHQTGISVQPQDTYRAELTYQDGTRFRCTMRCESDGRWSLLNLEKHPGE